MKNSNENTISEGFALKSCAAICFVAAAAGQFASHRLPVPADTHRVISSTSHQPKDSDIKDGLDFVSLASGAFGFYILGLAANTRRKDEEKEKPAPSIGPK